MGSTPVGEGKERDSLKKRGGDEITTKPSRVPRAAPGLGRGWGLEGPTLTSGWRWVFPGRK